MRFYSDIAYLVCISTGDPNCRKKVVCAFTCHMRADVHKLRVFSGDTIEPAVL